MVCLLETILTNLYYVHYMLSWLNQHTGMGKSFARVKLGWQAGSTQHRHSLPCALVKISFGIISRIKSDPQLFDIWRAGSSHLHLMIEYLPTTDDGRLYFQASIHATQQSGGTEPLLCVCIASDPQGCSLLRHDSEACSLLLLLHFYAIVATGRYGPNST